MMEVRPNILISAVFHVLVISAVVVSGGSGKVQEQNHIMVALIEDPTGTVTQQTPDIGRGSVERALQPKVKSAEQPETGSANVPDVQPRTEIEVEHAQKREKGVAISGQKKQDAFQGGSILAVPQAAQVKIVAYKRNAGPANSKSGSAQRNDPRILNAIRTAIDKEKKYPLLARKREIQGTVHISFRINRLGEPEDLEIVKGSGSSILDNATIAIVKRAGPFPNLSSPVEIPVVFRLTN